MSIYSPSGSGNVHIDRVMGGGKQVRKKSKRGMGFKAAAASAARSAGVSPQAGAAMVAAASRKASPKAKAANPNLAKVARKGTKKQPGGTFAKKGGRGW